MSNYNKYALLIGINYKKTDGELRGCINDVQNMKKILLQKYNYLPENIKLLTEDQSRENWPTAANIVAELKTLIRKSYNNCSEIWIHYSGHGASIRDYSGDELDGKDEVIVPLDYQKVGMLTDDVLNRYIKYFPNNLRVVCFFDCCNSGTVLDLKYKYITGDQYTVENKKDETKSNIVLISGCTDAQTSADAYINRDWAGAMTAAFLYSVTYSNKKQLNFIELLNSMREYLKKSKYTQIPQLTCANKDVLNTFI